MAIKTSPQSVATALTQPGSKIETRSIDFVTHSERFGKVRDLGPIWFVSSVNLVGIATGVATLSIGASLFWTIMATVLGSLFGTFFMALHSAQGPQLGLPQLVQSRPQFGYLGSAVTVLIFAFINYVAYNTSDALLSGGAAQQITGINATAGYLIATAVAAVMAIYGYKAIHRINKWLTWPMVAVLVVFTGIALGSNALPVEVLAPGNFELAPFMTVFVIVAGFQLGWAPYVSDYSRYLPATVGVKATFWWTYAPSVISSVWVFVLGAVVAAVSPGSDPVSAFIALGDRLFPGFGVIGVSVLFLGVLSIMVINQYGGSLALISIVDSFTRIRPTRAIRVLSILVMGTIVFVISQFVGIDNFNAFFSNVLIFLAYLFTPWTAINLIDYFFVRKGRYVVSEIFNPDGIYGRWGWRGISSYLIALLAMVPFMVTAPFTGFIAAAAGAVDYSVFVGLPVAAVAYLLLHRTSDLSKEFEMSEAEGHMRH
ncbi:purine-cytosine permease family protein [Pseudarthrobacter sp. O4]|uniref:purine-cytosine permease family protein n=1 Tax=Pseudarthrobacter sp. O4 TaxID=3418417 RepID=UPI003CE93F71